MIINVYSSGMYDVIDKNLNPIEDREVDFNIVMKPSWKILAFIIFLKNNLNFFLKNIYLICILYGNF